MKESTVVKRIRKLLKKKYPGFWFKTHGGPFQRAGLPDLIGCHKGVFIGIEVKVPGKEDNLSDLQEKTLRLISQAGGIAFMATTPQEVDRYLRKEFTQNENKSKKTPGHHHRTK